MTKYELVAQRLVKFLDDEIEAVVKTPGVYNERLAHLETIKRIILESPKMLAMIKILEEE